MTKYIAHLWPPIERSMPAIRVPVVVSEESRPSLLQRLSGQVGQAVWRIDGEKEVDPLSIISLAKDGSSTAYCNDQTKEKLIVDLGIKITATKDPIGSRSMYEFRPDQLPYLDYIVQHIDTVVGILITHIHADHSWAVIELVQLARDIDMPKLLEIPVHVTRFVRIVLTEMIRNRYGADAELPNFVEFVPSYDGEPIQIGSFTVYALPVNHSTPEACGFYIETGGRCILHLADFKLKGYTDESQEEFLKFIHKLTEEHFMDILSIDAVGAHNPGFTPSEDPVVETVVDLIMEATGRVIVAMFSTNLKRMEKIAQRLVERGSKRWPSYWGRSMENVVSWAIENGIIEMPEWEGSILDSQDPENQLWFTTGSQAEPGSQLWRAAKGQETDQISIQEGDTVIISAKPIPGREAEVAEMEAGLRGSGAEVVTVKEKLVHVSGHGSEGDDRTIIEIVQPVLIHALHAHRQAFNSLQEIAHEASPHAEVIRLYVGKRYEVPPVDLVLKEKLAIQSSNN